jgi:hypothetical protein
MITALCANGLNSKGATATNIDNGLNNTGLNDYFNTQSTGNGNNPKAGLGLALDHRKLHSGISSCTAKTKENKYLYNGKETQRK